MAAGVTSCRTRRDGVPGVVIGRHLVDMALPPDSDEVLQLTHGEDVPSHQEVAEVAEVNGDPIAENPCTGALAFKARLCGAFGLKFFSLVCAQYGLSQGAGGSLRDFAIDFFYKDVKGLGPGELQVVKAVVHVPWNVKPLYGLLSDTLPIFGLHRTYYIVMAGMLGVVGQVLLVFFGRSMSVSLVTIVFATANLSVTIPDVMVDAAVAEQSRGRPALLPDLQSLCWGSLTLCSLLASLVKGPLQENYGPEILFALAALAPVMVTCLAWRDALAERRAKGGAHAASCNQRLRVQVGLFCTTMRIPEVMRPAAFMFLRVATVPALSGPMFFFQTAEDEGYPNFSASFLGLLSVVGSFCGLLAIAIFNRYLREARLRRVFIAYGVVSFMSGLSDLVFVLRWNRAMGMSDTAFALGDDVLFTTLDTALSMPIQVLMTRLCPPTIEGTFFAILASLNNSSYDVARYFGSLVASALGVSKGNLSGLWRAVLAKQFFKVIPILLPFWLLPDASPLTHEFMPTELPPELGRPEEVPETDVQDWTELGSAAAWRTEG